MGLVQTASERKELKATLEAVNQKRKGMDTLLNRLGDNAQGEQLARILLANQLIGRQNIAYVVAELRRDPAFDFYCLVDSAASVDLLEAALAADPPGRPLQVLIELGFPGGRTGFRDNDAALAVARRGWCFGLHSRRVWSAGLTQHVIYIYIYIYTFA